MAYEVETKDGIVVRGIPDDVRPDDPRVKQKVETARLQMKTSAAEKTTKQAGAMALEGMSGIDKFLAGAGKSIADVGLGIRQLTGFAGQDEVDESKARDDALMDSGSGFAGNITGNVAQAFLPGLGAVGAGKAVGLPMLQAAGRTAMTAPATLTGAGVVGGLGAAQGAVQPVGSGESRVFNSAAGLIGGAAIPVAGMTLKAGKGILEPLYEGGRNTIVGRALNEAAGQNAGQVIQNLKGAQQLVPGSAPTAAEVANSGGIAALQRTASAVDPEAYATRAAQQNEARVSALTDLAGTGGQREFYDASRRSAADDLYTKAYDRGVDIRRSPVTGHFLPKAEVSGVKGEISKLLQRPAIQDAVAQARILAANEGVSMKDMAGSVKGLDYVKRALDDQIGKVAGNEQRVLVDLKNRLLTTIDRLSPDYAQARVTFKDMSKPINQMDVAQEIADKSINKLTGIIQPQAYARALSDDTAQRATGFGKATLENTMEPGQLGILEAIKGDLARSVAARDMGRGAGSDTVQKLAMTNLMNQAGLPVGLLNLPGLGRLGSWVYSQADGQMKQALATGLLNPKQTAILMEQATPSERSKLITGLLKMTATPVAGGSVGLLNAQ